MAVVVVVALAAWLTLVLLADRDPRGRSAAADAGHDNDETAATVTELSSGSRPSGKAAALSGHAGRYERHRTPVPTGRRGLAGGLGSALLETLAGTGLPLRMRQCTVSGLPGSGTLAITVTRLGRTNPGIPRRVRYLVRHLAGRQVRAACASAPLTAPRGCRRQRQ